MNRCPRLILFVGFIEPSAHCHKVIDAGRSRHDKSVIDQQQQTRLTLMKTPRQILLGVILAAAAFIGCEKKGDTISSAEEADKKAGVAAPGIAETKAIAEEGF